MPYRRRWNYRRRRKGVRKYRRLKVGRATLYKRMNRQGLFHVRQHINGSMINGLTSRTITQTLLAQNFGLEFRFRDIPQFGTFSNIWDQYRINKIVVTLMPMATVNPTGVVTTYNNGVIASVIDYDNGAQALAALDQYEQFTNCKITPAVRTKPHTRIFRPRINIGAQNQGGSILAAVNKGGQWIDCSLPDIAHNGLKIYVDPYPFGNPGGAQTWQVFAKYYISFRNVH